MIKRRRGGYSSQSRRAIELLNDPKWSWNRFPRKQVNFVKFALAHPLRSIQLALFNLIERILYK